MLQVDPSMVVRARIRLPVFPSPCLYQIFCFVRAVIHALCCCSFLCLDAFIVHALHSLTVPASHPSIIHASHSFIVHASHSFIIHESQSFIVHASHSFSVHLSAMQLGASLIFSSPWHVSSLRPPSQSAPLQRVRQQMYIRPTVGSHSCSLV